MKTKNKEILKDLSNSIPVKQTLDQIWGIKDNKYKSKTEQEYKLVLKEMSDMDLRTHCHELSLPYYPDRALNLEKLIKEFNRYKFQQRIYPVAN